MSDDNEPEDTAGSAHAREQFEEGEERAPPGVRAMAIVRWLLVLGMAVAALASIAYVARDKGHAGGEGGAGQYYCPMHPSVVQDGPGECPICNMSLVRRDTAESEHGAAHAAVSPPDAAAAVGGLVPVEIPEQRVQLIGVRTAEVRRATLPSELRAVGYVAPAESGLAVIQPRFSGWIQELHVTQTGQPVARGQLLARVYSPDLLAAQEELLNAKRWGTQPSAAGAGSPAALLEHARSRLSLLGMDAREIEEVERSGSAHRLIELRSPVKGYIAQKNALEGLFIQPGTRLFEVADLSKVWVMVEVFERDAGRVQSGQSATLALAAFPGQAFRGKVQHVYPALSAETRTLRARLEFGNADLRLRPGMFGDVAIQVASAPGLVVPREAVVDTGERQYVFVAEGGGRFSPRAVQVGEQSADQLQIAAGLREGETVVTTGNFLIDSESRLRATIEGSAQPAHAEH